jgi:hypothetical protein
VFFDKFGRTRGQLRVGPINVTQMPLGPDHPTSVPTVGDVLVGSLVPNARKSHLDCVLRGWSSDAKPLWELLRILRFGTRASEFEARSMLLQPSALLAQSSVALKSCRDDIYVTARVILWGNVRPLQVLSSIQDSRKLKTDASAAETEQASSMRISCKASEFVDSLTIKFADSQISESFAEGFAEEYIPEQVKVNPYAVAASIDGPMSWITSLQHAAVPQVPQQPPAYPQQQPPAYPRPQSPAYAPYSPNDAPYSAQSPPYTTESPPGTPMYGAPASPM